jgi:hypothetical protein
MEKRGRFYCFMRMKAPPYLVGGIFGYGVDFYLPHSVVFRCGGTYLRIGRECAP